MLSLLWRANVMLYYYNSTTAGDDLGGFGARFRVMCNRQPYGMTCDEKFIGMTGNQSRVNEQERKIVKAEGDGNNHNLLRPSCTVPLTYHRHFFPLVFYRSRIFFFIIFPVRWNRHFPLRATEITCKRIRHRGCCRSHSSRKLLVHIYAKLCVCACIITNLLFLIISVNAVIHVSDTFSSILMKANTATF